MNTTLKGPSRFTLIQIMNACFDGKNYNDSYFFDAFKQNKDESITGFVYKIVEKGKWKEVGKFEIDSDGYIISFPSIPEGLIEELNAGKEKPAKQKKLIDKVADKAKEVSKPKRRGRPKASKSQNDV